VGFGRNIQEAFDLGKIALMNLQVPEDHQPRLFARKCAPDPAKLVLAEVAVPRELFAALLARIGRLRAAPSPG